MQLPWAVRVFEGISIELTIYFEVPKLSVEPKIIITLHVFFV